MVSNDDTSRMRGPGQVYIWSPITYMVEGSCILIEGKESNKTLARFFWMRSKLLHIVSKWIPSITQCELEDMMVLNHLASTTSWSLYL